MEGVTGLVGALILALIVAAIFHYGFGRSGPWGPFWTFLLVLFFAAWAGSLWIEPVGPVIYGFAWLPTLFWIFIVALIIIAAAGEDRTTRPTGTEIPETGVPESEVGTAAALGLFFWILLGLFVIAILIGLLT